uniref:HAD-IC family P-type ATPase n=1 Tax=Zhenhengia sp. TaxID=2944208 RepID=UPI0030797B42
MKFVFRIEGIDCANCGAKIERALENDKMFDEAYLNFMLKKIEVHTKESDEKRVEECVRQIATRIESGVTLSRIDTGYRGEVEVCTPEEKHEHAHGEACGCGGHDHEHKHEVKHEHAHGEACGCGGHNHGHSHEEKHEESCGEGCGCSGHTHGSVECSVDKKDNFPVGCGCGCTTPKSKEKESNMLMRIICSLGLLLFGVVTNLDIFIFVSYIVIGYDIVLKAVTNIAKGKVFDENFLMTIATVAAFIIGEHPEAVAVMLFYQVGEYFQSKAVAKSRKAIEGLMDIKPEFARVKQNGNWVVVSPDTIKVGDVIAVRPGEKIPLDGVIVKGATTIDHSALTGESVPVLAEENSEVLSGSINIEQLIEIRVTQVLRDSTVSKILDLIENATSKKAQTEKFITKFAAIYTPIVVIAAVLIAIIPSLITGDWNHWVYTSIVFLVISCPCALVVSIPLGFFGGIGAASKQGVLIKGSNYLERLNE